jgi:hypothetical protein
MRPLPFPSPTRGGVTGRPPPAPPEQQNPDRHGSAQTAGNCLRTLTLGLVTPGAAQDVL